MRSILRICLCLMTLSLAAQVRPCLPCCLPRLNFLNVDPAAFISVQGDYLYWKAYSDTLDWAGSFLADNATSFRDPINILHAEFDWNSGFRISAGVSFCAWDNTFRWTSYNTKGSDSAIAEGVAAYGNGGGRDAILVPIWLSGSVLSPNNPPEPQEADRMAASFKLDLNSVDWEMGKSIYLARSFFWRPFIGVRGAELVQKMDVSYRNDVNVGLEVQTSTMQLTNDFFGVGPRLGVDGKWSINDNFSLFAATSCALLGGRFDLRENNTFSLSDDPTQTLQSKNSFKIHTFKPCFGGRLGMQFFYSFWDRGLSSELNLGYEFQLWPEQMQLYRLYGEVGSNRRINARAVKQVGDVAFHGLSLRASLFY